MSLDDFLRVFPLRAPNIMWFLGAGASASSGIMTAYDMLWDFKRALYCSRKKVSLKLFPDLSDDGARSVLQQFFDAQGAFPPGGADDEYAVYFEHAYPAEQDRRRFIDNAVSVGTPSYGHKALAVLMKCDNVRAVWTTNFDRMVEDAALPILGTSSKMVVATLGEPNLSIEAINEGRWPIYTKLHGDFWSRRLKNSPTELQAQDSTMRRSLVEACKRFGLAVVGFSGRDRSIMDALNEAIDSGHGYPAGLFWFVRPSGGISPNVTGLIEKATKNGIDAHIIEVETFDELMADILHLLPTLPDELAVHLTRQATRVADAPLPKPNGTSPIIRLNAIPISSAPSVCRLIRCDIGGTKEVRTAVENSGAHIIAARRAKGVIAFGSDSEMSKAFGDLNMRPLDVYPIETRRLRYDSPELSLLYQGLVCAIVRERPVLAHKRRSEYVVSVDPEQSGHVLLSSLREATSNLRYTPTTITGVIPGTDRQWAEALRIRLEYRLDTLWLVLEPTIWVESAPQNRLSAEGKEFIRKRLAVRYNRDWFNFLKGWVDLIVTRNDECTIRAYGIGDGLDASFTISRRSAFSMKGTTV